MRPLALLVFLSPLFAAEAPPSGFPFSDEALKYTIVWPSGLSLGEAKLTATRVLDKWEFALNIDASVPGYVVRDNYHSVADAALCSSEFDRETVHGTKKTSEKTSIAGGTATRQTVGGGKSDIAVGPCAHDALTYLFYARRELGQGKVAPAESILLGGAYQLRLQYMGPQTIPVGDVPTQADRVFCSATVRRNQTYEFVVFFARDAARTPLSIRAPFPLGSISMELVR